MTIPSERYNAIKKAYTFMLELLDPGGTVRVPKKIRKRAGDVLHHYPSSFDMEMARERDSITWGDAPKEETDGKS